MESESEGISVQYRWKKMQYLAHSFCSMWQNIGSEKNIWLTGNFFGNQALLNL